MVYHQGTDHVNHAASPATDRAHSALASQDGVVFRGGNSILPAYQVGPCPTPALFDILPVFSLGVRLSFLMIVAVILSKVGFLAFPAVTTPAMRRPRVAIERVKRLTFAALIALPLFVHRSPPYLVVLDRPLDGRICHRVVRLLDLFLLTLTIAPYPPGHGPVIGARPERQCEQPRSGQVAEPPVTDPVDPVEDPEVGVQLVDMAQAPEPFSGPFPRLSTASCRSPQ